ncbi:Do family serine endopeptidase [Litorimonas sp. WD9-15]|uniref:Do family serine endopeptidase n=1 Tax=Litorimonas sp. WD9-15 TaxID=3418716 RepID=UPI003D02465C
MKTLRSLSLGLALAASVAIMTPQVTYAAPTPDGFTELSKRLSPSVVNISTAQTIEVDTSEAPAFPEGSPLERFNDFFGGRNDRDGRVSKSLGSGFVIDDEGHIVTNNHVIEDADLIEVTFPNGDTYEAELVGRDPATDIAVLKIETGADIPAVPWGDSDSSEVGEWVIAIGNPFGYSGSVAAGIISARNRDISSGNYDDFIQTDVAINRGNSGGPLFNMDGEVIGVNTAILSPTGYSVGISFSVPSELAQSIASQLIEFGETRRGYLGVRPQAVSNAIAKSYGLDSAQGALVKSVVEGSPADKGGLQRGDLILSLGGEPLEASRLLSRRVAEAEIGKPLEIEILRKKKKRTITVEIERLKEQVTDEEKVRREVASGNAERSIAGISVEALSEDVRDRNRIPSDVKGVRVVKVNKRAEASGKILKGDIIEEVGFEQIATPAEFEEAMTAAGESDDPVTLLINRNGNYIFYALAPNS